MGHHHGGLDASPLLVGFLGVMAGAVLVAIAHCFIVLWCRDSPMTTTSTSSGDSGLPVTQRHVAGAPGDYSDRGSGSGTSSGSFSSTVQLVIASSYGGDGKDETCAVCLAEFDHGDEVRVLPGCAHTFHVSCIDRWLVSHRNCPLCRAETPRDLRAL